MLLYAKIDEVGSEVANRVVTGARRIIKEGIRGDRIHGCVIGESL